MADLCDFLSCSTSSQDNTIMRPQSVDNLLVAGLADLAAAAEREENIERLERFTWKATSELDRLKFSFEQSEVRNAVFEKRLEHEKNKKLRQDQIIKEQRDAIVDLERKVNRKRFYNTATRYTIFVTLIYVTLVHGWMFFANYCQLANNSLH